MPKDHQAKYTRAARKRDWLCPSVNPVIGRVVTMMKMFARFRWQWWICAYTSTQIDLDIAFRQITGHVPAISKFLFVAIQTVSTRVHKFILECVDNKYGTSEWHYSSSMWRGICWRLAIFWGFFGFFKPYDISFILVTIQIANGRIWLRKICFLTLLLRHNYFKVNFVTNEIKKFMKPTWYAQ